MHQALRQAKRRIREYAITVLDGTSMASHPLDPPGNGGFNESRGRSASVLEVDSLPWDFFSFIAEGDITAIRATIDAQPASGPAGSQSVARGRGRAPWGSHRGSRPARGGGNFFVSSSIGLGYLFGFSGFPVPADGPQESS